MGPYWLVASAKCIRGEAVRSRQEGGSPVRAAGTILRDLGSTIVLPPGAQASDLATTALSIGPYVRIRVRSDLQVIGPDKSRSRSNA
jgi:hypothetical protein